MSQWVRKKRTQQRMLQLSANTNPNLFFYKGDYKGFQIKAMQIINNPNAPITDIYATIIGNQTKQTDVCCFILTIIIALIFPPFLIVTCCECYAKMVNATYEVPIQTYQLVQKLTQRPGVRTLNLQVKDNGLGQQKCRFLYNMLSSCQVKDFTFYNSAETQNYKQQEWSDFQNNMKPIKMLQINSYIRWMNNIVN